MISLSSILCWEGKGEREGGGEASKEERYRELNKASLLSGY